MNDIQALQTLAAFGWFSFAVMCFVAFRINESWYKDCVQLNNEWLETCKQIIKQLSSAEHESESERSDE